MSLRETSRVVMLAGFTFACLIASARHQWFAIALDVFVLAVGWQTLDAVHPDDSR